MKNYIIIFFILATFLNGKFIKITGDESILDTRSRLMWFDKGVVTGNWKEAVKFCEDYEINNYKNWRLPNINELYSLVDTNRYNLAISNEFENIKINSSYWTSTIFKRDINSLNYYSKVVNFGTGSMGYLLIITDESANYICVHNY